MRRDERGRHVPPPLPADDLPSPEVLDELLRAFSADRADERTLGEIDLASPEVAELLAPPAVRPDPRPDVHPEVEVEVEEEVGPEERGPVEAEREPDVEVEVEVEADGEVEPERPAHEAVAAVPTPPPDDDDARGAVEVEGAADAGAAAPDVEPEVPPPAPSPATPATPSSPTPRTIRIDASEDPPDAVYLAAGDPLLAASAGGRGLTGRSAPTAEPTPAGDATVFIDDHDVERGETISLADASSATRIEPRMRERRIAVKRAAGRKRLRWALAVAVVVVLVVGALAVLGSSLFAIEEVTVDGAVYTDEAALAAVVEELEGTPVLRADTDRAEQELEAIAWVADARVTTQFPHGATIEIRERTPVASYQGADERFRVIDIDGRVLDVLDAQPADYLAITSPDPPDIDVGRFAPHGFIAAAALVQSLTPELRALTASLSVTANGSDLRMALVDGREVRFGAGQDLVAKLVRLQTRLDQVEAGGFQYIDVSTSDVTTG